MTESARVPTTVASPPCCARSASRSARGSRLAISPKESGFPLALAAAQPPHHAAVTGEMYETPWFVALPGAVRLHVDVCCEPALIEGGRRDQHRYDMRLLCHEPLHTHRQL